ncbi:glycoside hydrolase family 3 N-terminal domain-containing protein, partial [uncultured Muribaculum sp.]
MKKIILSCACAMLLAFPMEAQKKSAVSFDSYEWNFGKVNATEGAVCHTFTLKNKSKEPVSISKAIPSCECISAQYPTTPIAPGSTAEVMVVFTPAKSIGKSFRSVELLDDKGKTLGALSVEAVVNEGATPATYYPFRNPKLSNAERVENLISLLTPEEKVGLMMNKSISVDRLGIPSYNWWSEACHGVRQDGYTVYPQPIGMASAFSPELVYNVFSTVSDEARANWNRSDHDIFNVPMGVIYYPGNPELTFWCPNVNIFRDPRWGRGQETCGEDPYLNAVLGVQTVLGMQGNDDRYFKTHACAKHYAVHSGPEPLRHTYNASVSMRDLWETYLPAFKALVQKGNVREVMCAYNRYEGKPCCTSDRLLVDILRRKWGYDAIVLTDCDAINNFYNKGQHETHPDPLSASVDAVLNGTDLECGKVFMVLTEALDKGMLDESVLDNHLRKTLMGRFELGMFDPADMIPWSNLGPEVISSESNHELAVQAARESMV